ncbi:replication restart DNA helicase PriA [Rhizobiales bacterium GAS113]|nr:replication restart DNA helicase PriA [Rhizobiales bacterium GAS113]
MIADVLMPVGVDTAYSYRSPPGLTVAQGDVVVAPLGPRQTLGVVWAVREERASEHPNLKSLIGKAPLPALPKALIDFVEWTARWTLAPRGLVLRMALHDTSAVPPEAPRIGVRLAGPPPQRLTPARQRVLQAAAAVAPGAVLGKRALALEAGVSTSVVDALIDAGTLEAVALAVEPEKLPDPEHGAQLLSPAQEAASEALRRQLRQGGFSVMLLEGVTGSGKTEVYFEAVAEALRADKQVLILMPEIALTTQFTQRFEARFGARPGEWHSGVSPKRKAQLLTALAAGERCAVIGARSALTLPFAKLGLVIIDEEHDSGYKQEDGVIYHARDMAVVRARLEQAPVVLVSATPSIETRVNAEAGRYGRVLLPDRVSGRPLPDISAVDLRRAPPAKDRWLSPTLVAGIADTIAAGEQSLLFLNRRGYAPLTVCRACGHRFRCAQCSAWLVEHRFTRSLRCHHCGHREKRPEACPECGAIDTLAACGPGVERLAEEVAGHFPQARIIVLSSDLPGGTERLRREFAEITEGKADIVIGTQLIAKGHDFKRVALVGVVDGDIGQAGADPRANERTFQLLQQVTGRAGRGETGGRALIQTYDPSSPVISAMLSGDAERFYESEIAARRAAGMPPFGRLASLIVSGPRAQEALTHARAIVQAAHRVSSQDSAQQDGAPRGGLAKNAFGKGSMLALGPAEAPIAVIRGRHRFRILVKAPRNADLQSYLRAVIAEAGRPRGGVRLIVDVDPQSFL